MVVMVAVRIILAAAAALVQLALVVQVYHMVELVFNIQASALFILAAAAAVPVTLLMEETVVLEEAAAAQLV
jgi:hypothetical protein